MSNDAGPCAVQKFTGWGTCDCLLEFLVLKNHSNYDDLFFESRTSQEASNAHPFVDRGKDRGRYCAERYPQ